MVYQVSVSLGYGPDYKWVGGLPSPEEKIPENVYRWEEHIPISGSKSARTTILTKHILPAEQIISNEEGGCYSPDLVKRVRDSGAVAVAWDVIGHQYLLYADGGGKEAVVEYRKVICIDSKTRQQLWPKPEAAALQVAAKPRAALPPVPAA